MDWSKSLKPLSIYGATLLVVNFQDNMFNNINHSISSFHLLIKEFFLNKRENDLKASKYNKLEFAVVRIEDMGAHTN